MILKTEYQYIRFDDYSDPKAKTRRFMCLAKNGDAYLGEVGWYGPWRQYCFFPASDTIFNKGCMEDICHFIQQLMDERKRGDPQKGGE